MKMKIRQISSFKTKLRIFVMKSIEVKNVNLDGYQKETA
jgi:hypothetical protein